MINRDCFYYFEYVDMGCHVPCCSKKCSKECIRECEWNECDEFLSNADANKIIQKYCEGIFVEIPEGASNGDAILALLPEAKFRRKEGWVSVYCPTDEMTLFKTTFPEKWWDMAYKVATNSGDEIRDFDEFVKKLGEEQE